MNYLEAEDLTTGYGRQVISEALNCSFEAGTITSIIGPNGCGKSTLLKTLARILPAEKGKVFIKNQELQHFFFKRSGARTSDLITNARKYNRFICF